MKNLRTTGLAMLLLAAGCGDDDGGDDKTPSDDAGIDSGVMIDGGTDSGPTGDSGPTVDSGRPDSATGGDSGGLDAGGDSGTIPDAGGADASAEEIMQALNIDGVRTDNRRAELVIAAYCSNAARCAAEADAGTSNESECRTAQMMDWNQGASEGLSQECRDSSLDMNSCLATGPCDPALAFEICAPVCTALENLCEVDLEECE